MKILSVVDKVITYLFNNKLHIVGFITETEDGKAKVISFDEKGEPSFSSYECDQLNITDETGKKVCTISPKK